MDRLRLSATTRTALQRRLGELEARLEHLRAESAESKDPAILAAVESLAHESARVREALVTSKQLEDEPNDPSVVQPGDTVTIVMAGAPIVSEERFTLVSDVESRLDESWISLTSPMAAALLDRRVGETVEVTTPAGGVRYQVVAIERESPRGSAPDQTADQTQQHQRSGGEEGEASG